MTRARSNVGNTVLTEQEHELEQALKEYMEDASGELGAPPSPEELEAYRAGGLAPAEEERIRDHLSLDPASLALFQELEGPGFSAGPEAEGPQVEPDVAWCRLQAKLGREGRVLKLPLPAEPARTSSRWKPLHAVAASLLLTTVGLGAWSLTLQHRVAELSQPQAIAAVEDLHPPGSMRSDGDDPGSDGVVPAAASLNLVIYRDPEDDRSIDDFALEIVGAERTLWREEGLEEDDIRSFTLVVPESFLAPGKYRVRLLGLMEGEYRAIEDYPLQVEAR